MPLPTYLVPGAGQGYSARRVPWGSKIKSRSSSSIGDLADEGAADLELGAAGIDGAVEFGSSEAQRSCQPVLQAARADAGAQPPESLPKPTPE